MATLEQKIIDELKLALEYQESTGDYAQWLMGISLPSVIERKNDQLVITAKVVVKTSDSEYVDGMRQSRQCRQFVRKNQNRYCLTSQNMLS